MKKIVLNRATLIFIATFFFILMAATFFIQSEWFASQLEKKFSSLLPNDIGVNIQFEHIQVKFFPPGVSFLNPKVNIQKKNKINLPIEGNVESKEIAIVFYPFQAMTGKVKIQKVEVKDGNANFFIHKDVENKKKQNRLSMRWEDIFSVFIDSVQLTNVRLNGKFFTDKQTASFEADRLLLELHQDEAEKNILISGLIRNFQHQFNTSNQYPSSINEIETDIQIGKSKVKLERFKLRYEDVVIGLIGEAQGAVLEEGALHFKGKIDSSGPLSQVFTLLNKNENASGVMKFTGDIDCDLKNLKNKLHLNGVSELFNFKIKQWAFEKGKIEGAYDLNVNQNLQKIKINKFELESPLVSRVGGFQAGSGGRIEISPLEFDLNKLESNVDLEIPVHLKLTDAHLHWLAASAIADVYALDFRVNGPVNLVYRKSAKTKKWVLDSDIDFTLKNFQFDNQRWNKSRPVSRIVHTDELLLQGRVWVDENAIHPEELKLKVGETYFNVNGKVDFKTGYQLNAKGNLNFNDLTVLAENKVQGTGALQVNVYGPSDKVKIDFISDLENTVYLNLNLGHLKGLIRWDDEIAALIFKDIHLKQGATEYYGDGNIDFSKDGIIDLKFKIPETGAVGYVQDIHTIFNHLLKDLWWFPHSLKGAVESQIHVHGGLTLDSLQVHSNLSGRRLSFLGEKIQSVKMKFAYDKGNYLIDDVLIQKGTGQIAGKIHYNSFKSHFDWDVSSERFDIQNIDYVTYGLLPLKGFFKGTSKGNGLFGSIASQTEVSWNETSYRGQAYPRSQLTATSANGLLDVKSEVFGKQLKLDFSYDSKKSKTNHLNIQTNQFDASLLGMLLNPKLASDGNYKFLVTGNSHYQFKTNQFDLGTGFFDVDYFTLQKTGFEMSLKNKIHLEAKNGNIHRENFSVKGSSGDVSGYIFVQDSKLDGKVEGIVESTFAEFLTPVIARVSGKVSLEYFLNGTLRAPVMYGKSQLNSLQLKLQSMEQSFENITGTVNLKKNILSLQNINTDLAGGRVNLGGTIELFVDRYPEMKLLSNLFDTKLIIYPFQYLKTRGRLTVTGSELPYLVAGEVHIDSGLSREPMLNQAKGQKRTISKFFPTSSSIDGFEKPLFVLKIKARADRNVLIKNELLDVEAKGDLMVLNTINAPRLLGAAEVVQGKLLFKDNEFAIQSAKVEFENPNTLEAKFNLTSNTEVNQTKIRLYAAGTSSQWKVELSSNPPLSEDKILSLLALGFNSEDVNKLQAKDRGVLQQGEAASVLLYSLDFNKEVKDKTGFQIQLQEAIDQQSGTSIFRPQATSDTTAAPKIILKRSVGKKVDLSVGSTVGVGTSTQREVNAEVKVTPGMSVIGVWNSFEGVNAQDERTSYGVDLKLEKRFK